MRVFLLLTICVFLNAKKINTYFCETTFFELFLLGAAG